MVSLLYSYVRSLLWQPPSQVCAVESAGRAEAERAVAAAVAALGEEGDWHRAEARERGAMLCREGCISSQHEDGLFTERA